MSELDDSRGHGGGEHSNNTVEISMNNKHFKIHRGHQKVATIKQICGVPDTWVIELIGRDGTLTLLGNDSSIELKGGEKFISHVAGGGSS